MPLSVAGSMDELALPEYRTLFAGLLGQAGMIGSG
jgi:hypothetical protein